MKDYRYKNWILLGMLVGAEVKNKKNRMVICKIQYVLSELKKSITLKESKKGL